MRKSVQHGWGVAAVLCAALLTTGCREKKGEVSGSVTYKKRPLTQGTVLFFCPDQQIISRIISPDGTYSVSDLPVGDIKVAVTAHPAIPPGLQVPQQLPPSKDAPKLSTTFGHADAASKKFPRLPDRYGHPDHSGLAVHVIPGLQVFDIHLEP